MSENNNVDQVQNLAISFTAPEVPQTPVVSEKLIETIEDDSSPEKLEQLRKTYKLASDATIRERSVDITTLVTDCNVRDKDSYDLLELVASFKARGWDEMAGPRILAYRRADGKLSVLRGNRRTLAAQFLHREQPVEFARIFGKSKKVRVDVIESELDATALMLLRLDHDKRNQSKPLNGWEIYTSIVGLCSLGITSNDAIAQHLGLITIDPVDGSSKPQADKVGKFKELMILPPEVLQEVRKYHIFGEKAARYRVGPTNAGSPALCKAVRALLKEGVSHADIFRHSKFQEVWSMHDREAKTEKPEAKAPTQLALKAIQGAYTAKGDDVASTALKVATGEAQPSELESAVAKAIAEKAELMEYRRLVAEFAKSINTSLPELLDAWRLQFPKPE